MSAKAHVGTVLCNPKINRFPRLIVEYLYVKFGDPSRIGCWDIIKNGHTYKRWWQSYHHNSTVVGVGD